MIVAHLRHFNQNPEWDVRQVLPIQGFFVSAPHQHYSDEKITSLNIVYLNLFTYLCLRQIIKK